MFHKNIQNELEKIGVDKRLIPYLTTDDYRYVNTLLIAGAKKDAKIIAECNGAVNYMAEGGKRYE